MWFWSQYSKNISAPSVSETICMDQTSCHTDALIHRNLSAVAAAGWQRAPVSILINQSLRVMCRLLFSKETAHLIIYVFS